MPGYLMRRPLKQLRGYINRALDFGNGLGPTQLVDDGGDVTVLIHKGWQLEEAGAAHDVAAADDDELWREVVAGLAETVAQLWN